MQHQKKKVFTQPWKKLWAIFLYVKPVYDLLLALKICKRLWSIFFYVKLVYDLLLVLKVSIIYEQSLTQSQFEEKKGFTHYVIIKTIIRVYFSQVASYFKWSMNELCDLSF